MCSEKHCRSANKIHYLEAEVGDWGIVRTVHKTADTDTTVEIWAAVEKIESKVPQLSMGSDSLCI